MKDGLYQVTYKGICAGFIIEKGVIVKCAPILRRKIHSLKWLAVRIGD